VNGLNNKTRPKILSMVRSENHEGLHAYVIRLGILRRDTSLHRYMPCTGHLEYHLMFFSIAWVLVGYSGRSMGSCAFFQSRHGHNFTL
jgi:hypothetical protein